MKLATWSLKIALGLLAASSQGAFADPIPYPNAGNYNTVSYTFTAASTGEVIAYFAGGSGAGDDNQVGLMVNGVLTSAGFGLDNHTSNVGDSLDLGAVTAGDTLTIVMHNLTAGAYAYSDPALNVGYDGAGAPGHNHVYSTPYTGTSPVYAGVPVGSYVAFEDLSFPGADYNYNDGDYVFTNVQVTAVPEPATAALMLAGLAACGARLRRRRA